MMMRDIEFEEGEAYYPQNGDDDDENVDPDKDFSYIDKKIENFLGHHKKDFMGEVCAEILGARFGVYGSFLPMQQRSPPMLSNQRTQAHVSSKSPQNLPSQLFQQNPTNHSLQVKVGPAAGNNSLQAQPESGISSANQQKTIKDSADCAHNNQENKQMIHHSEQKPLKLRVKISDNSAIYNGLGLEISPSSSLEDSLSENDGTSPGVQEVKPESPSYIIKIMTTCPLLNNEPLSPLHDSLVCLVRMGNNLETGLSGRSLAFRVNNTCGNTSFEQNKEANKSRKSEVKDPSIDEKSKQKEPRQERKSKKYVQDVKPEELLTDTHKCAVKTVDVDRKEESRTSVALAGKSAGLKPYILSDKKNEAEFLEEDVGNSIQQVGTARDKVRGECGSASYNAAVVKDEGNANTLRGKTEKVKNAIFIMRKQSTGEAGISEVQEDKSTEGVPISVHPKQEIRKKNGTSEKISQDKEVGFGSSKGVDEIDKSYDIYEDVKYSNSETIAPSKQKTQSKVMPHSQKAKKSREIQNDGMCSTAEPSRRSWVVGCAAAEREGIPKCNNNPSISKGEYIDLKSETRLNSRGASNVYHGKKGKDVSSKDFVMGASERETHAVTIKDKSSCKRKGVASNVLSYMEGDLAVATNCGVENVPVPVADMPPAESVPVVHAEHWVECEKCRKWRLLPYGMRPASLPETWYCRLMDWWPGKNKCNIPEAETTEGIRATFPPLASAPQVQINQQAYSDVSERVGASGEVQHAPLPSGVTNVDATSGGKRRNLVKTEKDAAGGSGILEHIPVKMDVKNQRNLPRELHAVRNSGNGRLLKSERKRTADVEVSRVPKKMKRVRQQSSENPDIGHLSAAEAKGEQQNYDPGALRIGNAIAKGSSKLPLIKAKDKTLNATVAKDTGTNDVSGKKRKMKDRSEHVILTEERPDKVQLSLKNHVSGKNRGTENREEKKPKALNFQAREYTTDNGNGRTLSDGGKRYQKTSDCRKSSKKALDLGVSDNATTSSSSKISYKVKAKASEVKCSPLGSISSSPIRVSKSDPDKVMNKLSTSHIEPDELSSGKQLKSQARGTSDELAPCGEEMRDRRSNLSRNSGVMSDAAVEDHSVRKITSQPNLVSGNQIAKSYRLHCEETNSKRGKSHVAQIGCEKEPGSEKGNRSNAMKIDDVNMKLPSQVQEEGPGLRHPRFTGHGSEGIEASNPMKMDGFLRDAKTALKEAKNLKQSADHLKISGSGLESTETFFHAALMFLQGASLLEPGNSVSGRCGETSTEVYSRSAKLCENCAEEYERCNEMAFAALAYKCMEVAYLRVVYLHDLVASRDRADLQMAVTSAPLTSAAPVESPSSSASDIDNLNNQASMCPVRDANLTRDHRIIISAGHMPNFVRLLNFTHSINLAMEASRKSQRAFTAAIVTLEHAGKEEGIFVIKKVLNFSFHDVDGFLDLVRLAMEALGNTHN